MKNYFSFLFATLSVMLLSGCEAIGTIFKAGMWWGIILVVGVIALIIWLLTGRKK